MRTLDVGILGRGQVERLVAPSQTARVWSASGARVGVASRRNAIALALFCAACGSSGNSAPELPPDSPDAGTDAGNACGLGTSGEVMAIGGGSGLVLDGSHFYYIYVDEIAQAYQLGKGPKAGGPTTALAQVVTYVDSLLRPRYLGAVGGVVFFVVDGGPQFDDPSLEVLRAVRAESGEVSTLISGHVGTTQVAGDGLVVVRYDDTRRTWLERVNPGDNGVAAFCPGFERAGERAMLAGNPSGVFWISPDPPSNSATLWTCDAQGMAKQVATIAGDPWRFQNLAVDDTHVYWMEAYVQSKGIWRMALTGGAPEQVAASEYSSVLRLDATHVYYLHTSGLNRVRDLRRVPKAGGPPEALVANEEISSEDLQVDERHVWWVSTSGESCVRRMPKP